MSHPEGVESDMSMELSWTFTELLENEEYPHLAVRKRSREENEGEEGSGEAPCSCAEELCWELDEVWEEYVVSWCNLRRWFTTTVLFLAPPIQSG